MNYYVYAYLDLTKPGKYIYGSYKFDYEPFYIGKGKNNRIRRSIKYRGNNIKGNKFAKMNIEDILSLKLLENLSNDESLKHEIELISLIGRRINNTGPLVNISSGGEGHEHTESTKKTISEKWHLYHKAKEHTIETKELLSFLNKGEMNPMYGKTHTEDIKNIHSLKISGSNHPMYGKTHDDSIRQKIKENRFKGVDQKYMNEISRNRNIKPIYHYDNNHNLLGEYPSIKDASSILNISEGVIGKSCRLITKKSKYGYFRFKDESSYIMNNSFLIKEKDIFIFDNKEYFLIKRNKKSCIVEFNSTEYIFRRKDYEFLWNKKTIL